MHLSDAVLESVMVFRLGAGAVAEVVVPLCLYIYVVCVVYVVPTYDAITTVPFPH